MKAVVIEKPGTIVVKDIPMPEVGPGDLLIKVGACGICGTDLHIADGEFPPTPYPIVPGHEFAGEVVAVGAEVTGFSGGERVAVDPSLYCGHCHFCRAGKGNLCENWNAIGDTVDGGFAEYVAVPAANAYPLPDHLSYREGALIEPVSCAVHGIDVLDPQLGDTCLIVGAGTMGLMLLQLVQRAGAVRVAVLDLNAERLKRAEKLGAAVTSTDLAALLAQEPLGFDCVIDATGSPKAQESAFSAVKRGGKFLVFGVAAEEARVNLSPFRIYNDEITILGSMAILNSYEPAVEMVASGVIDTETLLTGTYPLDDFETALAGVRRGEGLKTQVLPNG
ncbi:MAG TPA: zinc-dependent alcohol dehydrogenase family protein [Thermomicrobiales bacterium]|nr:zinc-dependent alcohol dehydrogenase family protein [Thermomicrobiales bacterium]